jgi:putative ABC transport system permease protein
VGDTVTVEYPDGAIADLDVIAISDADLFTQGGGGGLMIDISDFAAHQPQKLDAMLMLNVAEGLDPVEVRPAIEERVAEYANVEMSNAEEYVDKISGQIDFALNIVTALLAMAILIALVGIMNTMALSIRERRREIGLLRAVGKSRSQVRRMVRWEAVLISVFGAVIGLVVGSLLGAAVVIAIGEGITLTLPWLSLFIYLVAAATGGVLFALWPAWRGAKTNVLEAIAYE